MPIGSDPDSTSHRQRFSLSGGLWFMSRSGQGKWLEPMEKPVAHALFRNSPRHQLSARYQKSLSKECIFLLMKGSRSLDHVLLKFPTSTAMPQSNGGPALEKGIWAAVIIAAVIVILRVFAKFKIKRFNVDDVLMIIAEV
jgi:hypothetical protein